MLNLEIIVGSTRETRSADLVLPWAARRARQHGRFDVEVLDLRDWPLPMFAEHAATIGDRSDPTEPATDTALTIALDDLAWWGAALKRARADGELLPGNARARAAATARQSTDREDRI